jgi:hypothetical protein
LCVRVELEVSYTWWRVTLLEENLH